MATKIPSGSAGAELKLGRRTVRLTNLRKPFWKDPPITKGDLLSYYASLAPVLLPHLRDRAMVMKRYPHGAEGKFFFMKRAPSPRPDWIETCPIRHSSGSVIDFPVVQDVALLLWIVNLGCIDLNPWYARCDDVDRPDYLHFDLDPVPGASFQKVVDAGLLVRSTLDDLGLPSLVKTTGSRGLHVYVPIERGPTQKEAWTFAKAFAKLLEGRRPDLVTAEYRVGQPLARYFPELVEALLGLPVRKLVIDGEIVVPSGKALSFDALLARIHPASSRVERLARETPALLIAFDILVGAGGRLLASLPLRDRRGLLEEFARQVGDAAGHLLLSPATTDIRTARRWLARAGGALDGVVAKRLDATYRSGDRTGMQKVKRLRTADCVVGGFRRTVSGRGIASLLLGLYDAGGLLHHVGFVSAFREAERGDIRRRVEPLVGPPGFTGRAPGGPSRWNRGKETAWEPVSPELVVEVVYDHFTGGRFRHGARFLRWRPDKDPRTCTLDPVEGAAGAGPLRLALGRRG